MTWAIMEGEHWSFALAVALSKCWWTCLAFHIGESSIRSLGGLNEATVHGFYFSLNSVERILGLEDEPSKVWQVGISQGT